MIKVKSQVFINIMLNAWVNNNFNELKIICQKVSKLNYCDDLLQTCVLQFLTNKKIETVPDNQKLFFFTKIVSNNYNSTTSPYYKDYHKFKFNELKDVDIVDTNYEPQVIDLNWVNNEISELKKTQWYYARLFELYLEENASLTRLSKRTQIPLNSVSRDIKKVRKILNDKRKKL
jgi:hypothetical protein